MGSNSSVPAKKVAPLEHTEPLKSTILPQAQSAKEASNLIITALRSVTVESTTPLSEQATASDKGTTPGESISDAQVVRDGEWLSREVERLTKKELDLEERENHLRERRLEINEQKQRLSAKEEDIKLQKLKVELKWKEFDGEKERLQKRYDWLVAEGIRQQRGESWLDGRQFWLLCQRVDRQTYLGCRLSSPSPSQKSEWERKRKLQTEGKTKDQQYRFKELQLKREVERLKLEDQRLRKKERRIEFEEAAVDREVERLVKRNREVLSEEIRLRDDDHIWLSSEGLKLAEKYLEEKEKEIGKTAPEQSGRHLD